jgi:hypothetical protein
MWRDETEAWIVARDSYGLRGLLRHVRYEGHPPGWYAVLQGITHFTWNVQWEKAPNFLFAVIAVTLVLCATKVRLWIRLGLVFSYFLMFEYAVIDRNYMMGILLVVAALMRLRRSGEDVWVPLLLGAAMLTSLPSLIVSVALFGIHMRLGLEDAGKITKQRWLGLLFVAVCLVGSVATVRPPNDSGLLLDSIPRKSLAVTLVHPFHDVAKGYLPLPVFCVGFWERNAIDSLSPALFTGLGVVLAVALVFFFRQPRVRWFFVGASLMLLGLMAVSRRTDMRHVGWLFVVFALSLLFEQVPGMAAETKEGKSVWRDGLLALLLTVQVIGGVWAIAMSARYPFSASQQVAEFLEEKGLATGPMIFAPDFVGLSVLAYLQRPTAYYVESHSEGSIVVWTRGEHFARHMPSRQELLVVSKDGRMPVLITEVGLSDAVQASMGVHPMGYFEGAISRDKYFVYH